MSFYKIVVALDDSTLSKAVFAQALALAQSTSASLLLFSGVSDAVLVQPPNLPAEVGLLAPDTMSGTYLAQQPSLEAHKEAVKALLQQYSETARQAGVHFETTLEVGDIEALLCVTAQAWGADLIVVGRRGRKGLSEALLGSVSNYAVHNAHCSVLVVQGEAAP
ncbi:MAG: universal stress protein [Stenomitos rutilans HA7619-LM2]|jgi:nucleotide-binding universal stress UspA family protein|nr:universal stress protein [Stenomitos rutilans HA7619-LM2]